jgi:hypothetical protein
VSAGGSITPELGYEATRMRIAATARERRGSSGAPQRRSPRGFHPTASLAVVVRKLISARGLNSVDMKDADGRHVERVRLDVAPGRGGQQAVCTELSDSTMSEGMPARFAEHGEVS